MNSLRSIRSLVFHLLPSQVATRDRFSSTVGALRWEPWLFNLRSCASICPGWLLQSRARGIRLLMLYCRSNFEITTTCSTRNFGLVRTYGADHLFDYNDPKAMELIKSHTHGTMKLCVDCISTDSSAAFRAAVLAPGAI